MTQKISTLILIIVMSTSTLLSQRETRLTNMHFIPDGEFIEDSGVRITFKSFWISNQITNKEFREFLDFAKNNPQDELMWAEMTPPSDDKTTARHTIKRVKYSELLQISLDKSNWPSENYSESSDFNNHPVIGVSKEMENYFCIWKTSTTYDNLDENDRDPVAPYYLPSSHQLKFAKKTKPELFTNNEMGFRIVIME